MVSPYFHEITLGFRCKGQLKVAVRSEDMVHNGPSTLRFSRFVLKRGLTPARVFNLILGSQSAVLPEVILQRADLNCIGLLGGDGFGCGEDAGQGGVVGHLLQHGGLADGF